MVDHDRPIGLMEAIGAALGRPDRECDATRKAAMSIKWATKAHPAVIARITVCLAGGGGAMSHLMTANCK
jgi:hypothetical protein